ncbi:MAG: outer membrane protein insertion porin family [Phormidium sp. OSCR]|nr:MAG: outer membrane protein insertion porin family [Phormidium sp. OSCR]
MIVDNSKWSSLTLLSVAMALSLGEAGLALDSQQMQKSLEERTPDSLKLKEISSNPQPAAIASEEDVSEEDASEEDVSEEDVSEEDASEELSSMAPLSESTFPAEVGSSWPTLSAPETLDLPELDYPASEPLASEITEVPETPATAEIPEISQTTDAPEPTPEDAPRLAQESSEQPQVLVSEVLVRQTDGRPLDLELQNEVYDSIRTQPGRTTTSRQLQDDVNAIYATGFFGRVEPLAEETPLGVRIIFEVLPNPTLNRVAVQNNQVLSQERVDDIFGDQYGSILNLRDFQEGVEAVNRWYQSNGYVLAQVLDPPPLPETGPVTPPPVSADGVVTLDVAEGVIEDIEVRFLSEDGQAVDEEGQPIEGRTRPFIVTREMQSQPGDVFNRDRIQNDLQRVFGLGLFDDINLSVEPGENPRQAVVVINAIEGSFGSVAAGGGFSSVGGFFGTASYQEQNFGGNNQTLGAEVQLGTRGLFFDVNFTDPWIGGDPFRTAYNVNLFRRRSISLVYDSGDDQPEVELPNGDRPRIDRLGGGVTFTRPLTRDVFDNRQAWTASLGLQVQEVTIRDSDGDRSPQDELGNLLAANEDGTDFMASVRLGLARDRRNNLLDPTRGDRVSVSTEQVLPFDDNVSFNRLRGSYSYYLPVDFLDLEGSQALAFNVQAGTIIGDMPPYEAFVLGGVNSVRGYSEGALGAGRSFLQATAEYRFPIFAIVGGVAFLDVGTDLGTAGDVPGNPADVRDKPGSGLGYGLGLRIQSPIGPIRVDFAINDEGENRFHFGIGQRF